MHLHLHKGCTKFTSLYVLLAALSQVSYLSGTGAPEPRRALLTASTGVLRGPTGGNSLGYFSDGRCANRMYMSPHETDPPSGMLVCMAHVVHETEGHARVLHGAFEERKVAEAAGRRIFACMQHGVHTHGGAGRCLGLVLGLVALTGQQAVGGQCVTGRRGNGACTRR